MSVQLELVQNGRVLKSYQHEGKHFVEAPPEGDYSIRLINRGFGQCLCVLSVDGVNVVDGTPADFAGPGYVLRAWETINIPGWRRSNNEVATFQFKPQEKSYTAQMGNGTSNTGVIGLAVFQEKEKPAPVHIHHHHYTGIPVRQYPPLTPFFYGSILRGNTGGFDPNEVIFGSNSSTPVMDSLNDVTYTSEMSMSAGPDIPATYMHASASAAPSESFEKEIKTSGGLTKGRKSHARSGTVSANSPAKVEDLGTGYGKKATMYTTETTFERATTEPSFILQVQYAMRERLIEWGVPVTKTAPSPQAFPASPRAAVRAPSGWQG